MENTEKIKLAIKGMHCASCSSRIEKVVSGLEGVESASVNLANQLGTVHYDPGKISLGFIEETITGLGFEARTVSDQENRIRKQQQETAKLLTVMKKRLVWTLGLAFLLLFVSMGEMVGLPLPEIISPGNFPLRFALLQFILVLPVIWLGRHFYLNGIPNLFKGCPDMDSLIAVGTGAAFLYSCWNLLEIILGIEIYEKVHDLYFESAGVIIALVSLGKFLETRARSHTSDAITRLMNLSPDQATLITDQGEKRIRAENVELGSLLLVRPGERIPVDGEVTRGSSYIDESMLTGESIPVARKEGDQVYGGTFNKNGSLYISAGRVGRDTVLSRIIKLVQEAQGAKAPIAGLADRVSLYFVPLVIVIAVCSGLSWYFIGGAPLHLALRFFIAVMVIACPCAMGLATPVSIMVGIGRGAQLGVLIKSGVALEMAQKTEAVIFDKTGTLTFGKPALTDIVNLSGKYSDDEILSLAAGAEYFSEHPLAEAVVAAARERNLEISEPDSFENLPGKGVRGRIKDLDFNLGNLEILENLNQENESGEKAGRLASQGKTLLYFVLEDRLVALLALADVLKPEVPGVIKRLRRMGLRLIMCTGDNRDSAGAVAGQAGIREIMAGVKPENKADKVAELQSQGLRVAMVGDGINDAPALARADVGIAMGTGIDIAIESGDIVVLKGNLSGVETAFSLSRATMRNIRQNLFWAFVYNALGIPVAAGLLYIFGGPSLNPMIAGGAMALSSVSVVSNGLRLRFFQI